VAMNLASETFLHKGKTWHRVPAEAYEAYVVGLDLGQSQDPSALSVVHYLRTPLGSWTPREGNHGGVLRQDVEVRYDVLHLERLQIGISYVDQVQYVAGNAAAKRNSPQ
jgi:hypothetical protein